MRKHLLAFLLATAAPVGAAQAWDIQCAQPLVIFGDNRPGPGMSTDVRVALDQDGKGWQVWHDLADGRIISRADQYAVNDLRNPAVAVGRLKQDTAWFGLLNGRPNLLMMGRLFDERGELIYLEELRDFRHDPSGILLMRTQADCGPDRDGRRWAGRYGPHAGGRPATRRPSPSPRGRAGASRHNRPPGRAYRSWH